MTFARDMAMAPLARLTVTIIGSIFGGEADRDRDREQQRLQPVVLGQAVDQEDGRDHHDDEADHQPSETADALVEGGGHAPPGDLIGEPPEERMRAGAQDDAGREPADDIRSHEADVGKVKRIIDLFAAGMSELFRRNGLPGQRGLVDEQVFRVEQSQVRGDHVPGR